MTTDNLVPAASYKATAVPVDVDGTTCYAQFGVAAGEKKTKQVLVQFEIIEGPFAGRKVPWWGYFTQNTYTRTIEALRTCGFKGDDLMSLLSQELTNEVTIVTEISEWQGKSNARVKWINSSGGGIKMANPMNTNDLRQFAAQMKAKTAAIKEVEGKKAERGAAAQPETAHEPPPPPPSDDDCPF
jgi:hypothetical protein